MIYVRCNRHQARSIGWTKYAAAALVRTLVPVGTAGHDCYYDLEIKNSCDVEYLQP
jgi:hypothetical protein